MEYKKEYTQEELLELRSWYKEHLNELPASFRMSEFNYIEDLKDTAKTIIAILGKKGMGVAFSGHLYQFFVLRDKLEAHLKASK